MSLIDIVKEASKAAVEAGKPMVVHFGTVTSANPLEVTVEQRLTLSEEFLIVPEQLIEYKLTVSLVEYTIRRGLEVDDKVILVRMQGGQQYIILDRMV